MMPEPLPLSSLGLPPGLAVGRWADFSWQVEDGQAFSFVPLHLQTNYHQLRRNHDPF